MALSLATTVDPVESLYPGISHRVNDPGDNGALTLIHLKSNLIGKAQSIFLILFCLFPSLVFPQGEHFTFRVVSKDFNFPWEILWGPDNFIWCTERVGKNVTRINPQTGAKKVAVHINEVYQDAGQDGLLGMALHPQLLQRAENNYVYVAYTYDVNPTEAVNRKAKIRRYTYDSGSQTLNHPVDLITNIPASNDHNSGRLIIGPDRKLYYTVGDLGANQLENKCNPNRAQALPSKAEVTAQDWTTYQGKILRLDLDGSIPTDNPLINGVRSHIYSYGHRNVQGIVFGPDGKLYASEHGPKSDDEINLIQAGKNYGWPYVAGYNDDRAYKYANWSAASDCYSLEYSDYIIPPSVPTSSESSWSHPDFVAPLKTLFTVPDDYNFKDPACAASYFICWPTVAPSGLAIYSREPAKILGWSHSLLMVSLKKGKMYRLKLSADGNSIVGDPIEYWHTRNRYRDIAVHPDGRTFYIATDNSGSTSGPSTGWIDSLDNPGAILEFQYIGKRPVGKRSMTPSR